MPSLMPNGRQQYFNSAGVPLSGGKIYTYSAGTTTPKATYSDAAGTTPNANPVVLDARGEGLIFWDGAYNVVVKDASDALIYSLDNYADPSSLISALRSDLATTSDSSKGVSLVGGASRVVSSVAALRALPKTGSPNVLVSGYYAAGDGGGGVYYYDSSDTTSADNGGTIIVASDGGRWKLQVVDGVTLKQFGAKGDGTTNDTSARDNATTWAKASGKTLYVTPGTYLFSTGWILNQSRIRVISEEGAILKFTAAVTTDAVFIDGGSSGSGIYAVEFRGLSVDAASAANAVRVRAAHHLNLRFRVIGAVTNGFKCEWSVLSNFEITVSANEGAFTATPTNGMYIDQRGVGEQTAYCTFSRPIIEGVTTGIVVANTLGNLFVGGTCEACTVGADFVDGSQLNKMIGVDFEFNSSIDIRLNGTTPPKNNRFIECDTSKSFYIVAGNGNTIYGGMHELVRIDAGSNNSFVNTLYNRNATGAFTDNSGNAHKINVLNGTSGTYDMNVGLYAPLTYSTPAIGASPYLYTNNFPYPIDLFINGGTVSQITRKRGSLELVAATSTDKFVNLEPGDSCRIAYTVAPSLNVLPRG